MRRAIEFEELAKDISLVYQVVISKIPNDCVQWFDVACILLQTPRGLLLCHRQDPWNS